MKDKQVKYSSVTDVDYIIEISADVSQADLDIVIELNDADRKADNKVRYNEIPFSQLSENGFDFIDESTVDDFNEDTEFYSAKRKAVIKDAFSKLTAEQTKLIQMLYVEELTQEEAALRLGITQQAISRRVARIKARLEHLLKL